MKSNWIHSAPVDLLFILPAVWLVPTSLALFWISNGSGKALIIAFTALLSVAHLISPLVLYIAKPRIRAHVKSQRKFAHLEVCLAFLIPLLTALLAWSAFEPTSERNLLLLKLLAGVGLIYHLFNSHHFTMQHFGITRLYLPQQGEGDIKLLKSAVWVISFVIPIAIWTFSNLRLSLITYFSSPLTMPTYLPFVSMTVVGVSFIALSHRAFQQKYLTPQLALSYMSFCLISFLICLSPVFFTLLLSSATHWIQTVFLTSYQLGLADPEPNQTQTNRSNPLLWAALTAVALMTFSYAIYATGHATFAGQSTISTFGDIQGPLARLEFSSFLVIGLILGVAFTHFYLERFIYRRNPYLKRRLVSETI